MKVLLNEKKQKIILWLIFAIYILLLFKLTVFRQDFLKEGFFTYGTLNLVPLSSYLKIIRAQRYLYMLYQFGGNIAWFIPFGFLLPYLTGQPKKIKWMVLLGLLLSFIIELAQFAFGTGISELDDLMLNTFGAFIGFRLFYFFIRVKQRKK